jgi:hypothetical protein
METALFVLPRARPAASVEARETCDDDTNLEAEGFALSAMTDFRHEYPITVATSVSIDAALVDMNRLNIHALPVIPEETGAFEMPVLGFITSHEMLRERPFRSADSKGVRLPQPRSVQGDRIDSSFGGAESR